MDRLVAEVLAVIQSGGTIFAFGNGGSAAQAEHLSAELVGRFKRNRDPIRARALTVDSSTLTAIANDYGYEEVFCRQIEGLVTSSDLVIGFSTSGRSPNVLKGLERATEITNKVWLFGGVSSSDSVDGRPWRTISVSGSTAVIQEIHLLLVHHLCAEIDNSILGPADECPPSRGSVVSATDQDQMRALASLDAVWVNGCFDILHAGHLQLLRFAASLGRPLIVGVNSDESVRQIKGPGRPIMDAHERTSALAELPFIDAIVIFNDPDPSQVLRLVRPAVVVKGPQYKAIDIPESQVLRNIGAEIVYQEELLPVSTTAIVDRHLGHRHEGS